MNFYIQDQNLYQYIIFPFLHLDDIYKVEDILQIKYKNLQTDCVNRINKKLNQLGYNNDFINNINKYNYNIGGEFILHCLVSNQIYKRNIIIYYTNNNCTCNGRFIECRCYNHHIHDTILNELVGIPIFTNPIILKYYPQNLKLHIVYKTQLVSYIESLKSYYKQLHCGIGYKYPKLIDTLANTYDGNILSIYNREAIRDHKQIIVNSKDDPIIIPKCIPKKRKCYNSYTGKYFTRITKCNKCDNCTKKKSVFGSIISILSNIWNNLKSNINK